MEVVKLHARIGQAVSASEEPIEGHAAATLDGAVGVCDLDECIDQLDDLGAAGGGIRVRWYAAPAAWSHLADAVEVAGDNRREVRCGRHRRHLAAAGCRSRWQAWPGPPVKLVDPGINRYRRFGVGGPGCLTEVDDGCSGSADTARVPNGGRVRWPGDTHQRRDRQRAKAGQNDGARQRLQSESVYADNHRIVWAPIMARHDCNLFFS